MVTRTIPLTIVLATETRAVPLATTRTREHETIITVTTDDTTLGITSLIGGATITAGIMTVTAPATVTTLAKDAAIIVTATATMTATVTMKNGIMTVDAINVIIMIVTVAAIAHHVDVPEVVGGTTDHGHPGVVHVSSISPHELKSSVDQAQSYPPASRDRRRRSLTPLSRRSPPRRRSPDGRLNQELKTNVQPPSRPSAPPELNSPPHLDSGADVRRPQRDPSPSPASPQPPSSYELRPSPPLVSSIPLDKGKAKMTPQSVADVNEDVKMVDSASPQSPLPVDQPGKSSPQPLGAPSAVHHLPSHPSLPVNPKRSRTSQSQSNLSTSSATRSSSNFRLPPIPPCEIKEVVKESLAKEASLFFLVWQVSTLLSLHGAHADCQTG